MELDVVKRTAAKRGSVLLPRRWLSNAPSPGWPRLCVVSANIGEYFGLLTDDVEDAVRGVLSRRTIAQTLAQMRQLDAQRHSSRRPASI